jgi:adenylate kinase family enzyme
VARPLRIAVIGTSGAGKSTLSRLLGAALALPVIELDAINWQAGWHDLSVHDPDLFQARVRDAIAGDHWVVDGNYALVRSLILERATDLVWLDYARAVVMMRVIRRSFSRAMSRRELWPGTGNVEHFSRWLEPGHPIRWTWSTYAGRKARYAALAHSLPARVTVHHLRRPADADALLRQLGS